MKRFDYVNVPGGERRKDKYRYVSVEWLDFQIEALELDLKKSDNECMRGLLKMLRAIARDLEVGKEAVLQMMEEGR